MRSLPPPGTLVKCKLEINLPFEQIPVLRKMCKANGFTINEMAEELLRAYLAGTVKITRKPDKSGRMSIDDLNATIRQRP
ncbi:MAG: hypothetical protein KKE37_08625 [Verrucomicrobia bacterium]|nr:hypothetical protein [Verrucomicrobiota bacterium]MBU4429400.1 hypothetical protein [Verrucomicrobiota bacterium]MCG2681441.1 hypothetical protein [Kiritimatiellia bacterium]